MSREDRIATLRARMESVGAKPRPDFPEEQGIPAPQELQLTFPRRTVSHCTDTPAFAVEIIRTAVQNGNFVAVVGWPDLLLSDIGQALQNVVTIPDPGPDPLNTVAVLAEGMDVVIYRAEVSQELSPVRARPLLGKLRKGNAALLLVNLTSPSPHVTLTAKVVQFHGIGPGTGRIRGLEIDVDIATKTGCRTRRLTVGDVRPRLRVV
ncbi:hypothetical protein J5O04_03945 [Corynebacterium hindlerae]|uniref:hypothetical protein n=1 Tax=Corynebacterium hindlerae TaxID=699041 RepID=UPI001AD724A4|nr:hypothetical protein [Corynebacterium hindlerae]QTH60288.1 hypothetical protein J5O04_03945 [Corynebacterium hindlerae]